MGQHNGHVLLMIPIAMTHQLAQRLGRRGAPLTGRHEQPKPFGRSLKKVTVGRALASVDTLHCDL